VDLRFYRSNDRSEAYQEKREPQAGPASCLSNAASKESNASGDGVSRRNPKPTRPQRVRLGRACRGRRAWRTRKEAHGTEEGPESPSALTARAKQEGRRNDKERRLTLRSRIRP